METKKCDTCKETKGPEDFNKNKSKKDGLNSICRDCSKKRSRQYYADNKELHIKNAARNKKTYAARNNEALSEIFRKGCLDCGNNDQRVLEFDHLHDKEVGINYARLNWSLKRLMLEIEKCDVVCANCHRIRTFTRKGCWRTKPI